MTDTAATDLRGQRALWRLQPRIPSEILEALGERSPMLSHVLYCRGFHTPEQIVAFFEGRPVSHDPFLLPDMDRAVARIARAIETRERVAVYGDFDCDGVTATAVLEETLRGCDLDPDVHIPERVDGHGLTPEALAALADRGVTLVVTADCGVNAVEEVQVARGLGLDVIITDHHEARPDGVLPACPTVSPTRHDSQYPFRALCGAGVAYKVAQALRRHLPAGPDPEVLLDFVALGTVADVVPLLDENRAIVIQGLRRLRETRRPGLLALMRVAGVEPADVDPISIAFYLAPRLNSANRMGVPRRAYDLITTLDRSLAATIATELNVLNTQRQNIMQESRVRMFEEIGPVDQVLEEVRAGRRAPVMIVIGQWPAGISGLLAAKLAETYGLPAFVGSADTGGTVAVSARGIPSVHIDELLEACEAAVPGGIFLGHGGHAGAGGFRVAGERAAEAFTLLEEVSRRHVPVDDLGTVLEIDAFVHVPQVTLQAAQQVRSLAPFGMGFPEPRFLIRDAVVKRLRVVGGGKTARVTLHGEGAMVDGVLFGADADFLHLRPGDRIDAVVHVKVNEWNGWVKPEVHICDWRIAS